MWSDKGQTIGKTETDEDRHVIHTTDPHISEHIMKPIAKWNITNNTDNIYE